jgi:hypothetical protein
MAQTAQTDDRAYEFVKKLAGDKPVQCLWQIKGPKNTAIALIECWALIREGNLLIIEHYKGGGFEVFPSVPSLELAECDAAIRKLWTKE